PASRASLAAGSPAPLTIPVLPTAAGSLTTPATVASDQFDSNPANNTSTAVTTVSAATSTPTPTATATTTPVPTSTATATPTIVPPICNPRPQVGVAAVGNGSGGLLGTSAADTHPGSPTNPVLQLQFGAATNALIDIPGGPIGQSGNFTVTLPAGTTQTSFTVRRATTGQASTVPLTVVDGCGPWPTFVGGGPTAF